jgi:hypothetical protein
MTFWASEQGGDARFMATTTHPVYTPPPGWAIASIADSVMSEHEYTHRDEDADADNTPIGTGFIEGLHFSGFRGGQAAPQVQVSFRTLRIQTTQIEGCAQPAAPAPAPQGPVDAGPKLGDVFATIKVESATYGGNCGAAGGNVTAHILGECNGNPTCDYTINHTVIGDPAPGCKKDYHVSYRCASLAGSTRKEAHVPGEAGLGTVLKLTCP